MKKLATLLLAAGLVLGAATGASAIDFKAKGLWDFEFNMGQNGAFTGGNGQTGFMRNWNNLRQDEFEAVQRIRLQLDAVASEALSGTVFFEIGDNFWGQSSSGGALGADNTSMIKLKHAYLDWMVPQTDLKVRMGIQGMGLPSFTTGSQVFNEDVAGITLNYKFNDTVSLTALWARPYNDNYAGYSNSNGNNTRTSYLDNVDAFGLVLPLTFDGVKVTPWVLYAAIGPNAFKSGRTDNFSPSWAPTPAAWGDTRAGMVPAVMVHKDGTNRTLKNFGSYGNAWWAGLTGQVTALDPFRIAWDINYGSVTYDDSMVNRHGWNASLLLEYKLDWAIPGLYAWYASGDDGDPSNGSERMPFVGNNSTNHGFSSFAFNGNPGIGNREGVIGKNEAGTWGIGARLKDFSFVEDLKHTLRVNYIGGTNNSRMLRYKGVAGFTGGNNYNHIYGVGHEGLYMTTLDSAMEFGLTTEYQMYENFKIYMDASYLATWLDHSRKAWGNYNFNGTGGSDQVRDPWNVNLGFIYSF